MQNLHLEELFRSVKGYWMNNKIGLMKKILHVAARLNPKMNLIKPALTGQFFEQLRY